MTGTIDKVGTWVIILGLGGVMCYLAITRGGEPNTWMLAAFMGLLGRFLPTPGGVKK